MTRRASKKNKVEKAIIFGLLLSNLVLGGMCYESNQQLTDVKNHYNYSNELNEELYDELNDVSRELEEQIYKTNSLDKEFMEKEDELEENKKAIQDIHNNLNKYLEDKDKLHKRSKINK